MKPNIILFYILTILTFTACTSSKSINYVNKNISQYKFAYQEIVSNNILGIIDQRKIDSLDKFKKYPHLKNLIDKKLICKKIASTLILSKVQIFTLTLTQIFF